jgi:2-amino-4-hydroxy-6-hydroxymethyldihydropteridine diphosphokinase
VNAAPAPVLAWVSLGANLGDATATVRDAMRRLGELPRTELLAHSSLYRSAPVQAKGADFINAVVGLRTRLSALALLHQLQAIELMHGRERPFRNAPRTLDLDLLLFGDVALHSDELTLPHPRGHLRAFVLRPLAELQPDLVWPGHAPIQTLLARLADQRIEKVQDP